MALDVLEHRPEESHAPAGGRPQRVIVVSGPQPGAGKTLLASNLAVAFLQMGLGVGVVDLDVRTRALSRWLSRRKRVLNDGDAGLVMPAAADAPLQPCEDVRRDEADLKSQWPAVLGAMSGVCDTLIVDAPAAPGPLSLDVHADADIVITPVVESPLASDAAFEIGRDGRDTGRPGPYGRHVWDARRRRARAASRAYDWILCRARCIEGCDHDATFSRLERLLGARRGPRIGERASWREGFEKGLSPLDAQLNTTADAQLAAQDLRYLLIVLKLAGLEGAALGF